MDNPILQHYLISLGIVALGLSGWVLPYDWNPLKLKKRYRKYVSDRFNHAVPKVFGALLIAAGVFIAYATAVDGAFLFDPPR